MEPMYRPCERELQQCQRVFVYHAPRPDQVPRYEKIRDAVGCVALDLLEMCPPSRELSLALTHLEEAVMWANASIARNEPNHGQLTNAQAPTPEAQHPSPSDKILEHVERKVLGEG